MLLIWTKTSYTLFLVIKTQKTVFVYEFSAHTFFVHTMYMYSSNLKRIFRYGKNICIYGENVFTTKDKEILQDMATYLGVSYTALTIRMKQLKLFEKHKLDEYISNELHLNNGKAGG